VRVAAIADLHCRTDMPGEVTGLLEGVEKRADVLLLPGDLTNLGLVEEAEVLVAELTAIDIPKIAVVGNHDHESGHVAVLNHMLTSCGIRLLDNDACELDGVEFVGTKGFAGGFGEHRLQPFGEKTLKRFIHHSIHEVAKFESALEKLNGKRRVALLHYSPIAGTLVGESAEIYPFLGFSLFADALDRHGASMVVHGHAHHGVPEGATPGGIPVCNVSRYVLSRHNGCAYTVFDV
jgi:Icc-related predicted phosphoesterase